MAAHEVPDRLSILTYVAQFYSLFKNAEKKSTMPSPSLPPRRPRDENDGVDLKTRSTDKSTTPNSEKASFFFSFQNYILLIRFPLLQVFLFLQKLIQPFSLVILTFVIINNVDSLEKNK